jgi:hypothetical protein
VRALVAEPFCAEVVMVNRKAVPLTANHRLRQVILDTAVVQFSAEVTKPALGMVALGDPVYGASCIGVGKGSMKWSEEELKTLEIGVVGGFAPVTLADEEDTKRAYPPQPSVHSPRSAARLRRGARRLRAAAIVGRASSPATMRRLMNTRIWRQLILQLSDLPLSDK